MMHVTCQRSTFAQVHIIYPKFIMLSFRKLDNPLDLQHLKCSPKHGNCHLFTIKMMLVNLRKTDL